MLLKVGQAPAVLDGAEFCAAAVQYGYSREFQAHCRDAVAQALKLVKRWPWSTL